eukprot:1157956-Pelagomonas_calceolata.AAC.3
MRSFCSHHTPQPFQGCGIGVFVRTCDCKARRSPQSHGQQMSQGMVRCDARVPTYIKSTIQGYPWTK